MSTAAAAAAAAAAASSTSSTTAGSQPQPVTTTIGSTVVKPPDFKMGKYKESYAGAKDFYVLSGGKPNSQWDDLDNGVKATAYNPNQHRSADARHKAKSYAYRIKGLTPAFKEGANISNFRDDIMDHLEAHGMDTISYLPDLSSSLSAAPVPMFSVIEHYPLFTSSLEKGLAVAKDYLDTKYDALDLENSAAAVDFLKNSLDPDLRRRLQTRVEPMDSFAMVWLRLMKMLVSHSSKHYDELRERVRKCTPRSFAEENLEKMCDFIRTTIEELEMAGQYQPSLTLAMLETVESDCTQKGSFNFSVNKKIDEVRTAVNACLHMDSHSSNKHMLSLGLDPKSISKFLSDSHADLLNDRRWTPAKRPSDTSKVPSAFAAMEALSG
jgi:hypothetical protein